MKHELHNTPYPDGTTVYAYDATGYPSGFPGANPPGDPVESAVASNFSVTFTEVEDGVPYIAAGKVNGEWRYIRFSPDSESPSALAAHEAASTDVHGIDNTGTLVVSSMLSANGKGYINHGEEAAAVRPAGFASVEWRGSVEPENAAEGDTWIAT